MKTYTYVEQLWKHSARIILMNNVFIFNILHMIKNPHWLVGPSHLTIQSLQVIEQFALQLLDSCGRLFKILKPW